MRRILPCTVIIEGVQEAPQSMSYPPFPTQVRGGGRLAADISRRIPRVIIWAESEIDMPDKTTSRKPIGGKVPEEAREHWRAAREELRDSIRALFPPEFVEHRRKARKEMLMAWRSMIDAALERMEEKTKEV